MQPQSLDAILKELDVGYNPLRENINKRISGLQGAEEAEVEALKAQERDFFENTIMTGARARGLGFSGIPEGERARYGSTHFLPAIARVRQQTIDQRTSLEEALARLNLNQLESARSLYNWQQEQAAEERRWREQLAAQQAKERSWLDLLGGATGTTNTTTPAADSKTNAMKQVAQIEVNNMMNRKGTRSFYEEVAAIAKSAGYGNVKDQMKLELLQGLQPGLFRDGKLRTDYVNRLIQMFSSSGGGGGGGGW